MFFLVGRGCQVGRPMGWVSLPTTARMYRNGSPLTHSNRSACLPCVALSHFVLTFGFASGGMRIVDGDNSLTLFDNLTLPVTHRVEHTTEKKHGAHSLHVPRCEGIKGHARPESTLAC